MVGLRKGICYRDIKRSYTRKSKYKQKGYIKSIPPHKIVRFQMGDIKENYDYVVSLVSKANIQIRQNGIESARQIVNRNLQSKIPGNYYYTINMYPHHILRENKMLGGAHADRLQKGMGHPFGKPINVAAKIAKGQKIMRVWAYKAGVDHARSSLKKAITRLAGSYNISIEAA